MVVSLTFRIQNTPIYFVFNVTDFKKLWPVLEKKNKIDD